MYIGYEVGLHYQSLIKDPSLLSSPEQSLDAHIEQSEADSWIPPVAETFLLSTHLEGAATLNTKVASFSGSPLSSKRSQKDIIAALQLDSFKQATGCELCPSRDGSSLLVKITFNNQQEASNFASKINRGYKINRDGYDKKIMGELDESEFRIYLTKEEYNQIKNDANAFDLLLQEQQILEQGSSGQVMRF